eukprot:TRINITY_DN6663_c0_g1_i4.p1 TRINITY_DN6663_c0_g1~~TRINITY_DN6663_c0_g1_i4.p1  ORF type:complete len:665 (+),score=95.67 TRINITY_DN6663_c0_g1_i4:110-2104(+)
MPTACIEVEEMDCHVRDQKHGLLDLGKLHSEEDGSESFHEIPSERHAAAGQESTCVKQLKKYLEIHRREMFERLDSWLMKQQVLVDSLTKQPQDERKQLQETQPEIISPLSASVHANELSNCLPLEIPTLSASVSAKDIELSTKATQDSCGTSESESIEHPRHGRSNKHLNSTYLDALAVSETLRAERLKSFSTLTMHSKLHRDKSKGILGGMQQAASKILQSWHFELFIAIAIALNSVYVGFQVNYASEHRNEEPPWFFAVIEIVFTLTFVLELVGRLVAEGRNFILGQHWKWNLFDVVVVASSIASILTGEQDERATGSGINTNLRILRIVRITRLIRIVRIVRVIRFIRALNTLLYSILHTLKALIWSMILLLLIIYIFGIVFTDAVTTHFSNQTVVVDSQINNDLNKYFGTLKPSMTTLFQSISGGLEWEHQVAALESISWIWSSSFNAYICFIYFAVLNVMTGVFCHSAIQGAERDHDMAVQQLLQDRTRVLRDLEILFQTIDTDGGGYITIEEFEEHFDSAPVKAFFEILGLHAEDGWTLFNALDADGDHKLSAEEFFKGAMQIRGTAKAADVAVVKREARLLSVQLKELSQSASHLQELVKHLILFINARVEENSRHPEKQDQKQVGIDKADHSSRGASADDSDDGCPARRVIEHEC